MKTLSWALHITKKINEQGFLKRQALLSELSALKLEVAQKSSRIRAIEKELKNG